MRMINQSIEGLIKMAGVGTTTNGNE